ncbi:MAG TPA: M13 family metallopeptidase [Terriglobales bacterium]|nr:M13 family metallopeptidase [Terriglobales bacterium]
MNRSSRVHISVFIAFFLAASFTLNSFAQTSSAHQPVLDVHSLDPTVDPCTDFYQYSCGGWMKSNPIPPDQSRWDVYSKMEDHNKTLLREILEQASQAKAPHGSVTRKIGDYYAACMNESAADAAGITPLESALKLIQDMRSKDDIASMVASMVYDSALFDYNSDQDFKDSSQEIAEVDQSGLGLPDRDYYFNSDAKSAELRNEYVAHMQKMFELLGDKPEAAASEAQTVMRIETALARDSQTLVERRDPNNVYHKMTIEQLQALSPAFAWKTYFAKTGTPNVQSLNVVNPQFFKAMDAELKAEDLANWKTYLRWHLVKANANYLSSSFVNESFDFYGRKLQGAQQLKPRWKRCVEQVDDNLGEALGQAYVERAFSPEAKQSALQMVHQIEDAMQSDIESLPWMSDATKQQALIKLQAVANKIGYPDKWRDYSALNIERNAGLENVLRSRAFEFRRQLNKIGKPVDRGEWTMTPPTVDAYYSPQMNDINFPAGILQPPVFDLHSDAAPNYGDTGATIGHELTHGFDDEGRQFDGQGNLREWWTPTDEKQFNERAACVVNQYSQYTAVDDLKVNGQLTLGENVADIGGVILAYMAWQKDVHGKKLQPMDGLTPEQRFFVGYAQSWCANLRDESKRMRVTIDPHSPEKYRTNGVVSDMPEFQQAFHCKADAPMVRKNACRVW